MRRSRSISLGTWGRPILLTALMGVWAAVVVNWRSPAVRLSVGWMNPLAFLLAMTLPSMCLVLVWIVRRPAVRRFDSVLRVLVTLVCVPAGLVSVPPMLLAVLDLAFGGVAHDPIGRVAAGDTRVVVYRTDGGATTAFGILVRQERTIVPGVLRVAELASAYRASEAHVELLGPHRIRLTIKGRRPREIALPLG